MALTLRAHGDTSISIVIHSSLTRPQAHRQEGGHDWCWTPRQLARASEVSGLGGEPTTPLY